MKKLIFLFSLFISLLAISANAQSTSPRWGSGPPQNDNTGRVLTYVYSTPTVSSSTAVLYQKPNAYQSIYNIGPLRHALTDSASITNAYAGDRITYIFEADTLTAGRVVTFGNHFVSAGTLTVDASQKASISFIFDGVAWIETGRAKQ